MTVPASLPRVGDQAAGESARLAHSAPSGPAGAIPGTVRYGAIAAKLVEPRPASRCAVGTCWPRLAEGEDRTHYALPKPTSASGKLMFSLSIASGWRLRSA